VEVARLQDQILVRDAKDPASGSLSFDSTTWQSFIVDLRNGSFGCR
jgi:Domain of unknown function (DUF397)